MADVIKVTPEILSSIEVFRELSATEYESLSHILKAQSFKPNQRIINLGEHTQDVFFVLKGKVRITTFTSSGKEVTFQDMKKGQMFGELSAIDGEPRSTNVVALTDSILAVAPPESFFKILRDYPKVNELILKQLTGLIRKLGDRIVEFSALSVKSRIHAEILRLAKSNMISINTAEIIPSPTHLDIANRISTHREAVSREISDLTKSGILHRTEGKLIVQDVAKLESFLDPQTKFS
ncbi:MAG: Crp/Fnr family transcriptional regulator, partial [Gammaproteobacteria bacterium]|nr:Crp/Fnr family transcriptional regulator [Gammaproteobacteria bacterium]